MCDKRCRITLSISPEMNNYKDSITKNILLDYINHFIKRIVIKEKIDITFQCSYDENVFDNSYENLQTKFTQWIADKQFIYTLNGFAQISEANAHFAHKKVLSLLTNLNGNYIGVGGESLIYGIIAKFKKITVYTNSKGVHENNLINCNNSDDSNDVACHLVDYESFELSEIKEKTICVANVSRNGIRPSLCKQLNKLYITDIIGVYCSDKYEKDLKYLTNYFIVDKWYNGMIYVIHFSRIPFISLGNTCCIAYQLQQLNLRKHRYPFDWMRYKKVDQLITCLENKFCDFDKIISSKTPTGIFPIIEHDFIELDSCIKDSSIENGQSDELDKVSTKILINKYGMMFPHDKLDNMHKYQERIFNMLNIPLVDYVIDCKITSDQIEKIISLLPNLRRLIIICDENTINDKVIKIDVSYIMYAHTPDFWKKNHIDWFNIVFNKNYGLDITELISETSLHKK